VAVAVIAEFDNLSKAEYEAAASKMDTQAAKDAGLAGYLVAARDSSLVALHVWKSREAYEGFAANAAAAGPAPSRQTVAEVIDQGAFAS